MLASTRAPRVADSSQANSHGTEARAPILQPALDQLTELHQALPTHYSPAGDSFAWKDNGLDKDLRAIKVSSRIAIPAYLTTTQFRIKSSVTLQNQRMDVTKRTMVSRKILQDGQIHLCQRLERDSMFAKHSLFEEDL